MSGHYPDGVRECDLPEMESVECAGDLPVYCPRCGSDNVQIDLDPWYRRTGLYVCMAGCEAPGEGHDGAPMVFDPKDDDESLSGVASNFSVRTGLNAAGVVLRPRGDESAADATPLSDSTAVLPSAPSGAVVSALAAPGGEETGAISTTGHEPDCSDGGLAGNPRTGGSSPLTRACDSSRPAHLPSISTTGHSRPEGDD